MKHFHFDFNNPADLRGPGAQICAHHNGIISAARIGGPVYEGLIEDNGFAATQITHKGFSRAEASDLLATIFDGVRKAPRMETADAATTAAAVVTTQSGLIYRSAGDAGIAVIGDNGRVIILNAFHSEGPEIYHYLRPSDPSPTEGKIKEDGFASWSDLKRTLGTERMRVAVMSDGISSSCKPQQLASDIEMLIKSYRIPFDDRSWAQHLVKAASLAPHYLYKPDDRVAVSAMRPRNPQEQVVIAAFDGVSPGKEHSAKVAYLGVTMAHEEVQKLFNDPRQHPMVSKLSRLLLLSKSVLTMSGGSSENSNHVVMSYQEAKRAAIISLLKTTGANLTACGVAIPIVVRMPMLAPFALLACTVCTVFFVAKILLNARRFSKNYAPSPKTASRADISASGMNPLHPQL